MSKPLAKKPTKAAAAKREKFIHNRKQNAERAWDLDHPALSYPLEYRRGVLHGLTAARAVAYQHNGGRSWTNAEIAGSISDLLKDLPAAIVVIGDALDANDEVPCGTDIRELFWAPRRK